MVRMKTFAAMVLVAMIVAPMAEARDLPRARAEHRATGCEAFGPGFAKLDGSDSCVKVSGQVRVESDYMTGGASLVPGPARR
jgi:hypothetical protein